MKGMRRIAAAAAVALAAAAAALAPALAQTSALKGHDSNAPVDVAADRIEVQDRADRAIFSGNVVVRQAQLTLTAPRLTLAYSSRGGIEIERIDATGGVVLRSPTETARGQFAVYDLESRLITLVGGVSLTRSDAQVNGGRLVIDLESGRAVMEGGAPGVSDQGGRVTGRFTVPQRSD
jgi:lipopolysaccharide export system protein LptA